MRGCPDCPTPREPPRIFVLVRPIARKLQDVVGKKQRHRIHVSEPWSAWHCTRSFDLALAVSDTLSEVRRDLETNVVCETALTPAQVVCYLAQLQLQKEA
jgi:hypothetical protein